MDENPQIPPEKPHKVRLPGVGMRTIKTVTAIALLLVVAELLHEQPPFYACVAAILTMRDTVDNSISFGVVRLISAIVGGLVAMLVLLVDLRVISPYLHIAVVCLGCFLSIYVTLLVKKSDAAAAATVTFVIIALGYIDDNYMNAYMHAIRRVIETIIGIVVAVLINKFMNFKSRPE